MFKNSIEFDLFNDSKNDYFNRNYQIKELLHEENTQAKYLIEDLDHHENYLFVFKKAETKIDHYHNKLFFWSTKHYTYLVTKI